MSRAPGLTHQLVVTNIVWEVKSYLNLNPIGIVAPGPGLIFDEFNGVIPDLLFVSNERRAEIASGERVTGAPDLVVEILSPGAANERRDRFHKLQLYSKYGVTEYWIVNPAERSSGRLGRYGYPPRTRMTNQAPFPKIAGVT